MPEERTSTRRTGTAAERASEFSTRLATSDAFRAELEANPEKILDAYGISVSPDVDARGVTLPSKEEVARAQAVARGGYRFGIGRAIRNLNGVVASDAGPGEFQSGRREPGPAEFQSGEREPGPAEFQSGEREPGPAEFQPGVADFQSGPAEFQPGPAEFQPGQRDPEPADVNPEAPYQEPGKHRPSPGDFQPFTNPEPNAPDRETERRGR
ncbi:MAG: hypothetical protein NVS4B2_25430 [Chloroflexota bacterium]